MSTARPDPFAVPIRILAWAGVAALTAVTLADPGATRMWSTPWTVLLALAVAAPVLALLLRAVAGPVALPPVRACLAATALAVVPLASALASPYRAPSLLLAGFAVGAVALYFVLTDGLLARTDFRSCLERWLTLGAAVLVVASFVLWLLDLFGLPAAAIFSRDLFERRNAHPLGHANYTAGLMLLAGPWLVRAAARDPRRRVLFGSLAALALGNLFLSGSRGGLLGLGALGVAAAAMSGLGWRKFLLLGAGVLAAAVLLALVNPRIRDLLRGFDPAAAPSVSDVQRQAMAHAGLLMLRERPLLGWGPGTTPLAYPRFRAQLDGGAENVLQLHALPVQVAAELGALGCAAAALAVLALALAWRQHPAAAATLAGYAVFSLTDHQLDVPIFLALLAALAALLSAGPPRAAAPTARLGLAAAVVIATGLVLGLGRRDPAPALNLEALRAASVPAGRERAVALLRESLALNPDQELAHFNLGWLLLVGAPAEAEQHFLAAAQLVPDKGGVYFGLALSRLNQGRADAAAHALALECINEPLFLASPWWTVPEIAALREPARREFTALLAATYPVANSVVTWPERQARQLATLAPRLGEVSPGPEVNYRRQRIGYPVLMRNSDLAVPEDLYDVREDPRFPASVPFPLPSKGWLPAPRLLKLLGESTPAR